MLWCGGISVTDSFNRDTALAISPGGRLQLVLMRHPPPSYLSKFAGGGGGLGRGGELGRGGGGVGGRVGGGVLAA